MALIKYILTVLIVSLTISNSTQCKYNKCPDPWNSRILHDHTMCLYSATSFGPRCNNNVHSSSLVVAEKKIIVRRHNELRARVAAGMETQGLRGGQPAGIIKPLKWHKRLALVAQRWANQCEFDHDKCRNLRGIHIGQNLGYTGNNQGFDGRFVDIVNSWYAEVKNFDSSLVQKYEREGGPITTHYTQLIWANTTHVGCGGVRYYDGQFYKLHLVCNYGPGGNINGESVYPTSRKKLRNKFFVPRG